MAAILASLKPAAGLAETVRRFPLSVLCIITVFLTLFFGGIALEPGSAKASFVALMVCGYFWFGAAALVAETRGLSPAKHGLLALAGFGFLALVFFQAGETEFRLVFLIPALLLLLMGAPFLRRGEDDAAFWAFNYVFWAGAGLAFVMASVLCVGLLVAYTSVQYLFDLKTDEPFGRIWVFCATLVAPGYALLRMPRKVNIDDARFTQACAIMVNFILIPLVCIYLLILYAYGLKILIEGELPRGGLAGMVAGFGGAGVFTYLAMWPVRESGARLARLFYRHFFKFLAAPLGLMAAALAVRIGEYGVTEPRYLAGAAFLWLSFLTLMFLARRRVALKLFPLSLAGLLFLASFGPWGAVGLSNSSQSGRLDDILNRHGLIAGGEIVPAKEPLPFADEKNLSGIIDYFVDLSREEQLPDALGRVAAAEAQKHEKAKAVLAALNLTYRPPYATAEDAAKGRAFRFPLKSAPHNGAVLDIAGYDYLLTFNGTIRAGQTENVTVGEGTVRYQLEGGVLKIFLPGGHEPLAFDIDAYAGKKLAHAAQEQEEEMRLRAENATLAGMLLISSLSGHEAGGEAKAESLSFRLLLDIK